MKRDQRLFDLVQILRDGRLHTASELADTLGVSARTIWRDAATLAQTGMPIDGERGLGYILRSALVLPPTLLTQDELDALVDGLEQVIAAGGPKARAARSFLNKVSTLLPQAGIALPEDP